MAHRDDGEAARAKIDALEAELAEARERAERAEAEAARANKLAKTEVAARARREKREARDAAKEREARAAQKKEARRRARFLAWGTEPETSARASSPVGWPAEKRALFRRGSLLVALTGYAAVLIAATAAPTGALDRRVLVLEGLALGAQMLAHALLAGRLCAPSIFAPTIQTLLSTPVALAAIDFFWLAIEGNGPWIGLVRFAGGAAVAIVGALVASSWAAEAASTETTGD